MNGGKNKQPLGYTIVEVLIVLAVSGVMFLIAATFISGKQAKTAFATGSNEFSAQVQSVISDVLNGRYSDVGLHCDASSNPLKFNDSGQQGQNSDCVFLGKFIHFYENGNPSSYEVFSLAANRAAPIGATLNATLAGSRATPITPNNPGSGGNPVELTEHLTVPQALQLKTPPVYIYQAGALTATTYGIGFVQTLGTQTNGAYNSGAQTVSLVYASSLNGASNKNETQASNLLSGANHLQTADSAIICIQDGSRYAQIILGGSNGANSLSATLKVANTCP